MIDELVVDDVAENKHLPPTIEERFARGRSGVIVTPRQRASWDALMMSDLSVNICDQTLFISTANSKYCLHHFPLTNANIYMPHRGQNSSSSLFKYQHARSSLVNRSPFW